MESLDLDVPQLRVSQLRVSPTGPQIIVKIDSAEYELVGLSNADSLSHTTTWVYNIESSWIQSITVLKDREALEKHGYKGENGVAIIRLKEDHIEDFLDGNVDKPMKIKTLN